MNTSLLLGKKSISVKVRSANYRRDKEVPGRWPDFCLQNLMLYAPHDTKRSSNLGRNLILLI